MRKRLRAIWTWIVGAMGHILNSLRVPGFVREGRYKSRLGERIRVRVSPLFTVINVRGLNVFFDRLTGRVDGVSLSQAHYMPAGAPEPTPRVEPVEPTGEESARSRTGDRRTD